MNVIEWIAEHADKIGTHALEIGSKKYKEHAFLDLKRTLSERGCETEILGCDISAGENVDIVVDLTSSEEDIHKKFDGKFFETAFCISVLEHIPDVFSAARNIEKLLVPGGTLFVSVPFVFRYHGYPGDLWRFTPEAIVHLFPGIDFCELAYSNISTMEPGDIMSLAGPKVQQMNRFVFRPKSREDKIERKRAKAAGEIVPAYSLAPSMINMLGFRKQ